MIWGGFHIFLVQHPYSATKTYKQNTVNRSEGLGQRPWRRFLDPRGPRVHGCLGKWFIIISWRLWFYCRFYIMYGAYVWYDICVIFLLTDLICVSKRVDLRLQARRQRLRKAEDHLVKAMQMGRTGQEQRIGGWLPFVRVSSWVDFCVYSKFKIYQKVLDWTTLPKTKIAPDDGPSQKENSLQKPCIFKGYVSFTEGNQSLSENHQQHCQR